MAKNDNTYSLWGPRYPIVEPVNPAKAKRTWLPWGKLPAKILAFGDTASASYLRKREATVRARYNDYRYDEPSSYPRRDDLLPEPRNGEF